MLKHWWHNTFTPPPLSEQFVKILLLYTFTVISFWLVLFFFIQSTAAFATLLSCSIIFNVCCFIVPLPFIIFFFSQSHISSTVLYHSPLCTLSYLFAEKKYTLLNQFSSILGFYNPKYLLPWCKPAPFDSGCCCHKAQCICTDEKMCRHDQSEAWKTCWRAVM